MISCFVVVVDDGLNRGGHVSVPWRGFELKPATSSKFLWWDCRFRFREIGACAQAARLADKQSSDAGKPTLEKIPDTQSTPSATNASNSTTLHRI